MAQPQTYLYEGLLLLSQPAAASDFGGTIEFIRQAFERAEADVIAMRKWDERRLAYTIKGQKRGTFILTYFRARGSQIPNIERDFNLSEQVLRSLILRSDHLGETELELARKDADLTLEADLRGEAPEARPRDKAPKASPSEGAVAVAEVPQPGEKADLKDDVKPSGDDKGDDAKPAEPPA